MISLTKTASTPKEAAEIQRAIHTLGFVQTEIRLLGAWSWKCDPESEEYNLSGDIVRSKNGRYAVQAFDRNFGNYSPVTPCYSDGLIQIRYYID